MSRQMTEMDRKLSEPELWVAASHWAVRKMRWYLAYAEVTIYLPNKALMACLRARETHPKIMGWLHELSVYRVRFEVGTHGWLYS